MSFALGTWEPKSTAARLSKVLVSLGGAAATPVLAGTRERVAVMASLSLVREARQAGTDGRVMKALCFGIGNNKINLHVPYDWDVSSHFQANYVGHLILIVAVTANLIVCFCR